MPRISLVTAGNTEAQEGGEGIFLEMLGQSWLCWCSACPLSVVGVSCRFARCRARSNGAEYRFREARARCRKVYVCLQNCTTALSCPLKLSQARARVKRPGWGKPGHRD